LITLEPCNHHGRVGPCTEAILGSGIRRIIYGTQDPNPRVAGQGARRLIDAGLEVRALSETDPEAPLARACRELIDAFGHWIATGRPWVVVKTAHKAGYAGGTSLEALRESMIPPAGQKTFTSPSSLKLAHDLRRRADAILTGSGTVLADSPEFTVRHVPEHEIVASGLKKRKLVVLDRQARVQTRWLEQSRARGFDVWVRQNLETTLTELGQAGVLEVLVEAGPELSSFILRSTLWDQHVLITQGNPPGNPDTVTIRLRS
jgi:diaminohydroxyphosphoribosylaminopyrimidine deaminase/5-amino-6-(5-phosphoribosylamino)uracil reductase